MYEYYGPLEILPTDGKISNNINNNNNDNNNNNSKNNNNNKWYKNLLCSIASFSLHFLWASKVWLQRSKILLISRFSEPKVAYQLLVSLA